MLYCFHCLDPIFSDGTPIRGFHYCKSCASKEQNVKNLAEQLRKKHAEDPDLFFEDLASNTIKTKDNLQEFVYHTFLKSGNNLEELDPTLRDQLDKNSPSYNESLSRYLILDDVSVDPYNSWYEHSDNLYDSINRINRKIFDNSSEMLSFNNLINMQQVLYQTNIEIALSAFREQLECLNFQMAHESLPEYLKNNSNLADFISCLEIEISEFKTKGDQFLITKFEEIEDGFDEAITLHLCGNISGNEMDIKIQHQKNRIISLHLCPHAKFDDHYNSDLDRFSEEDYD